MNLLKVDNSKSAAIQSGTWSNPGATFYDKLCDSFYCEELINGEGPANPKTIEKLHKEGKYFDWPDYLKEAYLIAPISDIKNSPYGKTPFSRSGCKYPHHAIKGDKLILSVPGVKAAYVRLKQMGEYKGEAKEHIDRHIKELGLTLGENINESCMTTDGEWRYRVEYNGVGIYEWVRQQTTPEEWKKLKESDAFTWLPNPGEYPSEYKSYFTELGYKTFMKRAFPAIEKYCPNSTYDRKLVVHQVKDIGYVVYRDEYQEIIDESKCMTPVGVQFEINDRDLLRSISETETGRDLYHWMHRDFQLDDTSDGWKLRTVDQMYKDGKGNCHDQAYFAAAILSHWGIPNGQLFFMEFKDGSDVGGMTHTLTWYKENNKYYWLENAWESQSGIHGPYTGGPYSIKQAVVKAYMSERANETKYDGIIFGTSPDYRPGMNLGVYVECWKLEDGDKYYMTQKKPFKEQLTVDEDDRVESLMESNFNYIYSVIQEQLGVDFTVDDNVTGHIPESGDFDEYKISDERLDQIINRSLSKDDQIEEMFSWIESAVDGGVKDSDSSPEKEFVPIYGIVKSYSSSVLHNDGTPKSESELSSVRFHKIIKKLTRGDNYSHALVSFDDSLTHMYSYEDEGFVVDNIMTKESWMGTQSIYICVMFVTKEDKARMKKFVDDLIKHADQTAYASANLLKAYVGTPYKVDKRFVCSSFTGYILSCSNPKNLHRDYSRLRPEDITILPRSFYVMNVKDREDFIKHRTEIKKKVKSIYNEYHDEIEDYNNHLPKLMLQDRVDKLKTVDRIFDWIIDRM